MLLLTAFIEVASKDREAIAAGLAKVIPATRAEEGCAEYGCYEDTLSPGRYVFVERWRDQASLDRHLATSHMAAWMSIAGPLLKAAKGFIYDADAVRELRPK